MMSMEDKRPLLAQLAAKDAEIAELRQRVEQAERVRDLARAASQRDLEAKREAEQRAAAGAEDDPRSISPERIRATVKWRVGSKVPINVYEGDRPVCQCHSEIDAQYIVGAVNALAAPCPCDQLRAEREQCQGLLAAEYAASDDLRAQVKELAEALRPFAEYHHNVIGGLHPDNGLSLTDEDHDQQFAVRVKHLRKARAALAKVEVPC